MARIADDSFNVNFGALDRLASGVMVSGVSIQEDSQGLVRTLIISRKDNAGDRRPFAIWLTANDGTEWSECCEDS